jgi:hypothetical protein
VRAVALLLLVLALGGCGGEHGARLDGVRPCLAKLGVVAKSKPPPTPASPEGDASLAGFEAAVLLAFAHPGRGANNVDVDFFHDKRELDAYERRFDDASWPRPPAPNVLLRWSTQPTAAQKRRVAACFGT